MKRLFAVILVFILLMSSLTPAIAEHIDNEVGNILKNLGVLKGDKDTGDLMLDDNFKRQDMVVMISRLYKEEEKAKNYVGTNIFKDLNKNRKFYIPYITWAKDEGLIEGMEKDKFGFNGYVTVQQFQTVLLRALGYGEEAKDWELVPEYAKSLGIMKDLDLNPSDKLPRGKMAQMVLNTLNETTKAGLLTLGEILNLDIPEIFKVDSEISIDKNTVIFKGSTKGTKSLKLNLRPTTSTITSGAKLYPIDLDEKGNFEYKISDLETGSYEYRFESGNKTTAFKSFKTNTIPPEEIFFDFIDAKAESSKEIHLIFTKPIDIDSASSVKNYDTNAGDIKEVKFKNDNKTIVLILDKEMTPNKLYKISTSKIKSKDKKEIQLKDIEFNSFSK